MVPVSNSSVVWNNTREWVPSLNVLWLDQGTFVCEKGEYNLLDSMESVEITIF